MATRVITTNIPALELAGQFAGTLASLQMPGYQFVPVLAPIGPGGAPRLAKQVDFTPMQAEFDLGAAGLLLDWALSLPRGTGSPVNGAALVLDANDNLQRRVEWTDGLVTELRLPLLDATAKAVLRLGLSWQPGTVSYAKSPGGKVQRAVPGRGKALLASNFRVQGLPFDGSFVTQVQLPTVTARLASAPVGEQRQPARAYGGVDLGELTIRLAGRSRDEVLAWLQKVVADGRIADGEFLALKVELLDASLKKVLATVNASGCMLLGYEEDPLGAAQAGTPGVQLRLAVGQLDLQQSP